MAPIRCFLIEKTDRWHTEPCRDPECKKADCWLYRAPIYRRADTGQEGQLHQFGPGAMWYTEDEYSPRGPDGKSLHCMVPAKGGMHAWCIDGRASNCTMKDDTVHRCWVRHGEPPNVTVDKNGHTCNAGAGSILTDGWHGFLRGGQLETC